MRNCWMNINGKGQKMKNNKKIQIKIKKRKVKDNTRVGAMYCFKNCVVNVN